MTRRHRNAPSIDLLVAARPRSRWSALCEALADAGFTSVRGDGLEEALRALGAGRPALVLVDLGCDDAQQSGVGPAIEAAQRATGAPVAALASGYSESEERELRLAFEAGAEEFLSTNERPELAVERVRGLLARCARRSKGEGRRVADVPQAFDPAVDFDALVRDAAARCRRERKSLAVVCFDFERMRRLGGAVLASHARELSERLATRLREACRREDVVARMGGEAGAQGPSRTQGDELALILEGSFDDAVLTGVARRFAEVLRRPIAVHGHQVVVGVNVGVARLDESSAPESLLENARAAAYCVAPRGVGAVQLFDRSMKTRAFERLALESALRQGIERQELVLHYQPRVSVDSGRTVAVEALVRWNHPNLGLVPPGEFIPLAEETGLIVPLGRWVLEQACRQARAWQDRGFEPVRVSVNVSPVQFRDAELFGSVEGSLRRAGLDPRWLELELTESSLMHDVDAVIATLQRFKALGIGVSIDDFGTGYSSLAYLRRFPIDALKIDRSFLREVTRDPDDASIATAIVLMAKCLRLRVVAEGVESPGQLAFLRIMKCDEAQGFHFGPPAPADEVESFLARRGEGSTVATAA